MSGDSWAALIGIGVYFALRVIDRLLPPDTHFGFMDRLLRRNKTEEDTDG